MKKVFFILIYTVFAFLVASLVGAISGVLAGGMIGYIYTKNYFPIFKICTVGSLFSLSLLYILRESSLYSSSYGGGAQKLIGLIDFDQAIGVLAIVSAILTVVFLLKSAVAEKNRGRDKYAYGLNYLLAIFTAAVLVWFSAVGFGYGGYAVIFILPFVHLAIFVFYTIVLLQTNPAHKTESVK